MNFYKEQVGGEHLADSLWGDIYYGVAPTVGFDFTLWKNR